jgi:hypothetical protein
MSNARAAQRLFALAAADKLALGELSIDHLNLQASVK